MPIIRLVTSNTCLKPLSSLLFEDRDLKAAVARQPITVVIDGSEW